MTKSERERFVALLGSASIELETAIALLDDGERPCAACKMNIHHNQQEWKAHVELTAALAKVQKWRAELDFPKMVPFPERTT